MTEHPHIGVPDAIPAPLDPNLWIGVIRPAGGGAYIRCRTGAFHTRTAAVAHAAECIATRAARNEVSG